MDITAFLEGVYQATQSTNNASETQIRAVSMTGLYKSMNFRITVSQPVYTTHYITPEEAQYAKNSLKKGY